MKISIVIPTLNEEDHLGQLLEFIFNHKNDSLNEVVVVDAKSTDRTREIAEKYPVQFLETERRSRPVQLNYGAKNSNAEILYFLHADTIPPPSFLNDIIEAVGQNSKIGGYQFKFKSKKAILKINSWFTRFNLMTFRGGDQSMYITRKFYNELGGFDEEYCIMEEYDLMRRAKIKGEPFNLIPKNVWVSDRKYDHNSYLQVNYANLIAMRMFHKGKSPKIIQERYYQLLHHPKDI